MGNLNQEPKNRGTAESLPLMQKVRSSSDDGRWTMDDSAIVYRPSSIVTRTSAEYPHGGMSKLFAHEACRCR